MSRHTRTGSRYDASSCHATGATDEARVAARERGAREQQHERDLAVVERVEELGARDLEVVGAGDRQVDLGRAVEAGDRRRHVRPQEGLQRLAPLRRLAEHLDEPLLFVVVVATELRLDADLAPQRDRVHRRAGRLGDAEAEHDRGHRGVRLRHARRAPSNDEAAHRASRPHVVEERVERVVRLAARRRSRATASAAGRRARNTCRSARGSTRPRSSTRSKRTRNASTSGSSVASSACAAVSSSQVSSGSSDSVAPAGLG